MTRDEEGTVELRESFETVSQIAVAITGFAGVVFALGGRGAGDWKGVFLAAIAFVGLVFPRDPNETSSA
jgi:hypothetical protein